MQQLMISVVGAVFVIPTSLGQFLRGCPDYLKATWFFWAAPLLVALLLLRPQPAKERRAQQVAAS